MKKLEIELVMVREALKAAEAEFAAAGGQGPKPRLGDEEAAVHALGGVQQLADKMRAMQFRCGWQYEVSTKLACRLAGWRAC
jgi:hypothetical protein